MSKHDEKKVSSSQQNDERSPLLKEGPEQVDGMDFFATTPALKNDEKENAFKNAPSRSVEGMDFFATAGALDGEGSTEGMDFFATAGVLEGDDSREKALPLLLAARFELLDLLGKGGMGQVFKALDRRRKHVVALKLLYQQADEELIRDFFLHELKLHQRLHHPNIVRIEEFHHDPLRGFFFTMEWIQGKDLASYIAERKRLKDDLPFDRHEILRIFEGLTQALHHAHRQGIVHLDLKPSNILLNSQEIKLIDFGIASLRRLGHSMNRGGTPYYMSPEQLNQKGALTPASDIYSLGIILYQLLTGELFQAGMPLPSQFNSEISDEIDAIHEKMVAWQPEKRFQDVRELWSALRRALLRSSSSSHQRKKSPTSRQEEFLTDEDWRRQLNLLERKRPAWLKAPLQREKPQLLPSNARHSWPALSHRPLEDSLILLSKKGHPLLEFIPIEGGIFTVGAEKKDKRARRFEKPQKEVELSTFWIARFPITRRVWDIFLEESGYEPAESERHPDYLAKGRSSSLDEPLNFISYVHAWGFCDFYGLSLPSEAQWEAAVRSRSAEEMSSFYAIRQWTADQFDKRFLRKIRGKDFVLKGEERSAFYSLRGVRLKEEESPLPYRRDGLAVDSCVKDLGFRPTLDLAKRV